MNCNNQGSNEVQAARLYNSCLDQLLEKITEIVRLEHRLTEPPNCNPKLFSKCQCTSPAKYSPEGFGNCNFGASKADKRVRCLFSLMNSNEIDIFLFRYGVNKINIFFI